MTNKGSNWLLGCGLGCGLLVVLAIGLTAGGFFVVKESVEETMEGFGEAVESRRQLEERFGKPETFVPAADGSVAAQRLEIFLTVREATAEQRLAVTESFAALPMSEEEAEELEAQPFFEKMRSVAEISSSAFGLSESLGALLAARNQVMLEQEMGMGEYSYVYALAYYAWLGHSPADGPSEEAQMTPSAPRLRRNLLRMLRNQLEALPEDDPTRASLTEEIEAVEADRRRLPWQDGLPPAIAASFEPYRDRLEATYDPATNPFELSRSQQKSGWSVEVE